MTQQTGGQVHFARGVSIAERTIIPILAVMSLVALVIARVWPVPSVDSGQPTCIMRIATGLPCPGCGMTRSWVHLAHGDVARAFEYNFFGPIGFAMAVVLVVWTAYALLRRIPTSRLLDRVNPRWLVALTVVWLGYSVVRMISLGMGQDYFALVVA